MAATAYSAQRAALSVRLLGFAGVGTGAAQPPQQGQRGEDLYAESTPKPTSATEPATTPADTATTASIAL